jgi:hypothetical protein
MKWAIDGFTSYLVKSAFVPPWESQSLDSLSPMLKSDSQSLLYHPLAQEVAQQKGIEEHAQK